MCTDGAPNMLGSRSGFLALVKRKNPAMAGIHCIIHREGLASKTLPAALRSHLEVDQNCQFHQRFSLEHSSLPGAV